MRKQERTWPWIVGMIVIFGSAVYLIWSPWADDQVEKAIVRQYSGELDKRRAEMKDRLGGIDPAEYDSIPGAGAHDHYDEQGDFWLGEEAVGRLEEAVPTETRGDTLIIGMDTIPPPPGWVEHTPEEHAHFGMSGEEAREEIGNWITAVLGWLQEIITVGVTIIAAYASWKKVTGGSGSTNVEQAG